MSSRFPRTSPVIAVPPGRLYIKHQFERFPSCSDVPVERCLRHYRLAKISSWTSAPVQPVVQPSKIDAPPGRLYIKTATRLIPFL